MKFFGQCAHQTKSFKRQEFLLKEATKDPLRQVISHVYSVESEHGNPQVNG